MDFPTVFASLARNRLGAILVVVQVALTLTIILNATGIIRDHIARMNSVSGVDEANVFSFTNRWIGQPTDSAARVARDVAVLRATPGVLDAVSTNGVPLSGSGWGSPVDTKPVEQSRMATLTRVQLYYLDEHGADALGLRVVAGRWFLKDEVFAAGLDAPTQSTVIITRTLAEKLFPGAGALGRIVYTQTVPLTVIGIVDALQQSSPGDPSRSLQSGGLSLVLPARMAMPGYNNYVVRTRPGAMASVMTEVQRRLQAEEPLRVITRLQPFLETRAKGYRGNRALTIILVSVSAMLLLVTGLGIVGLTSYWVAQRRRLIGVRRALGARRIDITAYFQTENLVIVGCGIVMGVILSLALNLMLVKLGVPRIATRDLITGVIAVLALGQFAAIWPALRAASIPPALATRSG
jgi:putative ABC transport system permease protein